MNTIAHDLFLLMVELAQSESQSRMLEAYTEFINRLHPDFSIVYQNGAPAPDLSGMIIGSEEQAFGSFRIVGDSSSVSADFPALLHSSIQMLAVLLEKLRNEQTQGRFQHLLESMPQSVFSKDLEGRFTFANMQYCRREGRGVEEILGKTDFDLHPVELAEEYRRTDRHLIETGRMCEMDEVHQPIGREKSFVHVFKTPIYDSQGHISGILGMFWDITKRKQAEKALKKERQTLFAVLETLPVIVHLQAPDYSIPFVNQQFREHFGDPGHQPCYEVLHRRQEPCIDCPTFRVLETKRPEYWEWTTHEGRTFMLSDRIFIDTDGGELVLGVAIDITERKQAEEALRRLNETLESRVRRRTADFEASNKELNEFAYIVSHDLKAPLRGVTRLSQWLQEDYAAVLDAKGQEKFRLLREQVRRMDELIDGILRYSRAAQGRKRMEAVDMSILVAEVLKMLAPPAHVRIRVEGTLPSIYGDPIRMTQIFQNLLENALKFMDKAEGLILVGCEESDEAWRFWVHDNGPGIEPRHHERIFQIFQTSTPVDSDDIRGIGLTVVKKIVEFYGGRIWVESAPDQGSCFFFTWPKDTETRE